MGTNKKIATTKSTRRQCLALGGGQAVTIEIQKINSRTLRCGGRGVMSGLEIG